MTPHGEAGPLQGTENRPHTPQLLHCPAPAALTLLVARAARCIWALLPGWPATPGGLIVGCAGHMRTHLAWFGSAGAPAVYAAATGPQSFGRSHLKAPAVGR